MSARSGAAAGGETGAGLTRLKRDFRRLVLAETGLVLLALACLAGFVRFGAEGFLIAFALCLAAAAAAQIAFIAAFRRDTSTS